MNAPVDFFGRKWGGGGFRERDGVDVCGVGGSGGEYISANICHSWKL